MIYTEVCIVGFCYIVRASVALCGLLLLCVCLLVFLNATSTESQARVPFGRQKTQGRSAMCLLQNTSVLDVACLGDSGLNRTAKISQNKVPTPASQPMQIHAAHAKTYK